MQEGMSSGLVGSTACNGGGRSGPHGTPALWAPLAKRRVGSAGVVGPCAQHGDGGVAPCRRGNGAKRDAVWADLPAGARGAGGSRGAATRGDRALPPWGARGRL